MAWTFSIVVFRMGFAARWRRKTSLRVYADARKVICISEKIRQLLTDGMAGTCETVNAEVVYKELTPMCLHQEIQKTSGRRF